MIYLKLKKAFLSLRNSLHKIDMIGCPKNFLTYCMYIYFYVYSESGNISNPDEEILNLIKYLKDNLVLLQSFYKKFSNEGKINK